MTEPALRLQGKVVEWNDERGFGFVLQHGETRKVFLHHSDVEQGRPKVGDIVTFVVVHGERGPKSAQVRLVRLAARAQAVAEEDKGGVSWLNTLIGFGIVGVLAWYGWSAYKRAELRNQPTPPQAVPTPPAPAEFPRSISPSSSSQYVCDGRKHCSEMKSCEEAKFFINNCPGTLMDSDNDGVPCETSLCR